MLLAVRKYILNNQSCIIAAKVFCGTPDLRPAESGSGTDSRAVMVLSLQRPLHLGRMPSEGTGRQFNHQGEKGWLEALHRMRSNYAPTQDVAPAVIPSPSVLCRHGAHRLNIISLPFPPGRHVLLARERSGARCSPCNSRSYMTGAISDEFQTLQKNR